MKNFALQPAELIVRTMERIYRRRMTTTSGGNISVKDMASGDIWITPSGVDKGALTPGDICRITPDGNRFGPHRPSVELPFHATIYKRRPDLRAVLHAHPPALQAFAIARVVPNICLLANVCLTLGKIAMAEYAMPGSQELGDTIAAEFEKGFDIIVMENHGVVIGAEDLLQAFMKLETLESNATLEICARKIGMPKSLQESEICLANSGDHIRMHDFLPDTHNPEEREARRDMISLIHRACRQKLFASAQGTCSLRLGDGSFLITPHGMDRAYMEESDLVLIKSGRKERGKTPSRAVSLHQKIYEKHPAIRSVFGANPPHVMAFAVTDASLNPRATPEGYLMLRQVQRAPFSARYLNEDEVPEMFSAKTPVVICENDQVLATGSSLIHAYDRLEVAEALARSAIAAEDIGALVHISNREVDEIHAALNLD